MSGQLIRDTDNAAGEFVKVAEVNDITTGRGALVEMDGVRITIFNSHGAFYATESRCLFCQASLMGAQVKGTEIQCPSDGACFYLPTGEPVWPKADDRRLATYRVRVDGHAVQVKCDGDDAIKR